MPTGAHFQRPCRRPARGAGRHPPPRLPADLLVLAGPQLGVLADGRLAPVAPDQRGYSTGARPPAVADYRWNTWWPTCWRWPTRWGWTPSTWWATTGAACWPWLMAGASRRRIPGRSLSCRPPIHWHCAQALSGRGPHAGGAVGSHRRLLPARHPRTAPPRRRWLGLRPQPPVGIPRAASIHGAPGGLSRRARRSRAP